MEGTIKYRFRKESIRCAVITTVCYLLVHGYRFMNKAFAGDALLMVYQNDAAWQIALGRFVQPILIMLRGSLESPLLIGLLTALWLGAGAYLLADIFKIEKNVTMIFLALILSANDAITASNASFLPWTDFYGLAFFTAVLGVWFLQAAKWWRIALAVLSFMLSLGTYQAYICVAIGISGIVFIFFLSKEKGVKKILKNAAVYAVSFLGAAGIYYGIWKIFQKAFNIWTADTYNGLSGVGDYSDTSLVSLIILTYKNVADYFINPPVFATMVFRQQDLSRLWLMCLRGCNLLIFILFILGLVMLLLKHKPKAINTVFILLITAVFPFGINVVCFISKGMEHQLMTFAFGLCYLLVLLVYEEVSENNRWRNVLRIGLFVIVGIVLWSKVVFASQVYLKRDLQDAQAQSLLTRIVYEIEKTDGYEAGVTPVAFCGTFENTSYTQPVESMKDIVMWGMYGKTSMTYGGTEYAYLQMILNVNMNLTRIDDQDDRIKAMPCYPADGSVAPVDDVIVVKLSD